MTGLELRRVFETMLLEPIPFSLRSAAILKFFRVFFDKDCELQILAIILTRVSIPPGNNSFTFFIIIAVPRAPFDILYRDLNRSPEENS